MGMNKGMGIAENLKMNENEHMIEKLCLGQETEEEDQQIDIEIEKEISCIVE